jgi:hypothetical protein
MTSSCDAISWRNGRPLTIGASADAISLSGRLAEPLHDALDELRVPSATARCFHLALLPRVDQLALPYDLSKPLKNILDRTRVESKLGEIEL